MMDLIELIGAFDIFTFKKKLKKAGILTAWSGSLWIVIFTFIIAVPIGISAGVFS